MASSLLCALTTIALLITIASCTPLWERQQNRMKNPKNTSRALEDYKLPSNIIPLEYDIHLIPYLEIPAEKAFTFDGKIQILFRVQTVTKMIRLHAYDLNIDKTSVIVTRVGQDIVFWDNVEISVPTDDRNFLTINFSSNLVANSRYTLDINFIGNLNDNLEGFYRSSYIDEEGNKKWLAVTQFESTGARRAFPCFDEPSMKAQFTIHIARAMDHVAQSNMPMESETPALNMAGLEGWRWVHFGKSVTMSSYLVAFSVNQYQAITHVTDPRFKVWARPERVHQGQIANDLAPKIISYMERYTDQIYALPKLDQIAIPDMDFGAMENWGLVTYRESALLHEEGVSTSYRRQYIETIVTHELAHQWFGNLVSPKWWDNIWLNEGFATYFEYHALATVQDTWQLEKQFVYEQMHSVLRSDALESTHALLVPEVESPQDANGVFDIIAYSKGGCIVRMLVHLIGESNFKAGIRSYMNTRRYSLADMDDLWLSLTPFVPPGLFPSGVTLKSTMDSWTLQPGYPVIYVSRNYTTGNIRLLQARFLTQPDPEVEHSEVWTVPLTMTSQANPNFDDVRVVTWQRGSLQTLYNLQPSSEHWIIFNLKQVGYYRVNYDATNWGLLSTALNDHSEMSKIHVINRAQLIDDSLALARAGLLDYNLALDTTGYLSHETEYHPWAVALTAMGYLVDRSAANEEARELFQWYMLEKLGPAYSLVNGFTVTEDDSHITRLKRSLVLSWACFLEHEECNMEAARFFKQWQANPETSPIAPDLKSVVYCAGMRKGGQEDYDFLFERYEVSADITGEQSTIVSSLGCASDTGLLSKYLEGSVTNGSAITGRRVLTAVYNNPLGVNLALDFIINNWETAKDFYGGEVGVGFAFTGIAPKLNTQEHSNKLEEFLAANNDTLGATKVYLEHAIQTVSATLGWHVNFGDHVVTYLEVKREEATPTPPPSAAVTSTPLVLMVLVLTALVSRV